jgi:hypothetical protein
MQPDEKENPALGVRGVPNSDQLDGSITSENISSRPLTQAEAWRLACVVFGSELPSPRRDICGTSADGIRYWRVAR